MRASSLSNPRVIELLNAHFVPVYISNEDYRKEGAAHADDKAQWQRIYRESLQAKLSTGTVHVYILSPEGKPLASQHVATAYKPEELTPLLERIVAELKVPAGKPLAAPAPQSTCPQAAGDALVLHLVARNVTRKGSEDVPHRANLGQTRSAGWGSYPVENWIVLEAEAWRKLLPAKLPAAGGSWELDKETAARLLTHFYPSTENNDVSKNRIDRQELRATVLSVESGAVRARLDGSFRMTHWFYHKDDGRFLDANLVGLLEFDTATGVIRSLRLATTEATYGATKFGVALESVARRR
jgi:hypothetical protein